MCQEACMHTLLLRLAGLLFMFAAFSCNTKKQNMSGANSDCAFLWAEAQDETNC